MAVAIRPKEREVVELARHDINVFARYVFGITNTEFHRYLNQLIDAYGRNTFDAPVEFGKTSQVSIIRPTFELGRDPFQLLAMVSSTPELPRRTLKVIRDHMETNERLHRVFPKMKLAEAQKAALTVQRPRSTLKDPSIVAMGIEGAILGRRWTYLITDDILRFASTWTEHMREVVWNRLIREAIPRLGMHGRHTDIGTPWVSNDARHRLRRLPGYRFVRFDGWAGEARDINGRLIRSFDGGLWPEISEDPVTKRQFGWPRWRLEKARKEMPGYEFDRQIRCIALSGAMEIFGSHIDACKLLGRGIKLREEKIMGGKMEMAWRRPEPQWRTIFTGVDLNITKASTSHDTAFYTGAFEEGRKHLIELRVGKIEGPDIIRCMIDIVRRYPLHRNFVVETNQGQKYIQQFAEEPGLLESFGATKEEAARIRITSHTTTSNKAAEGIGVRAMSVDFEQRRWPIPCDDELVPAELVQRWIEGLRSFDPVGHADDTVIASWLFSEACRNAGMGGGDWGKFGIFVP